MKWWRTEGGKKRGRIMDEDNRSALEQEVLCVGVYVCLCEDWRESADDRSVDATDSIYT